MGLMSPITGRLFDKYGARVLAMIGLTITVISTFYLSRLGMESGYYYIMRIYTIRMLGISMVMMPVMTNGLNQLPMISNPHGTAMNNTLQQVSGAIGSAILLTIMTKRMESTGAELFAEAQASGNAPTTAEGLAKLKEQLEAQAMLDGISFSFFISTIVAIVALVLSLFMKRVALPTNEKSFTKSRGK